MTSVPPPPHTRAPIQEEWVPQGRELLLAEQREKGKCAGRTNPTATTAHLTYTSS